MMCGLSFSPLLRLLHSVSFFFFFNDTATTEIYTLSLHDALPIYQKFDIAILQQHAGPDVFHTTGGDVLKYAAAGQRSEEHTSELQSRLHLVCRLLLEKKKQNYRERAARNVGDDVCG